MIRPTKRFRGRGSEAPKVYSPSCFEEEPTPALSLINLGLKQTGSSYVRRVLAQSGTARMLKIKLFSFSRSSLSMSFGVT